MIFDQQLKKMSKFALLSLAFQIAALACFIAFVRYDSSGSARAFSPVQPQMFPETNQQGFQQGFRQTTTTTTTHKPLLANYNIDHYYASMRKFAYLES